MNKESPYTANSANPEPSTARAEKCICGGNGREPDPSDDNLRTLRRLRDFAMAVAEKLTARIVDDDAVNPTAPAAVLGEAPDAPKPRDDLPAMVLGFQRAERAVRQCILLSSKLYDDRLARDKATDATSSWAEKQRRERHKKHAARLAKEAIERGSADEDEEFERLQKLNIRLDEEDIDSDLGRLADSALVDRLCKDCGVEPPWDLWDGEHWAQEEALHKPPGSVFAGARRTEAPEETVEPVEPVEAAPPQSAADEAAASAAEPPEPEPPKPEPEPPKPEPDTPYEAEMKARLVMALRSGAWLMALQMDPRLASYLYSRLLNSS